jgi:hypothetical protein
MTLLIARLETLLSQMVPDIEISSSVGLRRIR